VSALDTERPGLPRSADDFLTRLRALHDELQCRLWVRLDEQARSSSGEPALAVAVGEQGGDVIYALDRVAEEVVLPACAGWAADWDVPFVLVAEGLPDGQLMFPAGAPPDAARFVVIADPVDGTRGLMYSKRAAWSLAAVAPVAHREWWREDQAPARLVDVALAVQTELPTHRAYLADQLWAVRGAGAAGCTRNLLTGDERPLWPRPSTATTLDHGWASLCKALPWGKVEAAALEERLLAALGAPGAPVPPVFDDQYLCTGGQLYGLMTGQDRFLADLRPALPGVAAALTCHPYDICTALIAAEAGVALTDGAGAPLDAPLDTHSPVAWIGYANADLRAHIEPVLLRLLAEREAR
jgi:hypothetical protein